MKRIAVRMYELSILIFVVLAVYYA